ncbi:hypothetical protein RHMOL_Rhmol09G0126800 [Rhododendron molle]|uniref:Uncharacterized protein n=1 Tax=Rhododendron molle TaxID=49168 RepID=A0ACC0MED9_RHOML|nr:hypothetical protein RHMOL_Rhmol09G0126800 [Rhododendron molle]
MESPKAPKRKIKRTIKKFLRVVKVDFGLAVCSELQHCVAHLRTSDCASDNSDLTSTINDREPFITEMRFESMNARSDRSEVLYTVLRTLLHNTIPQFVQSMQFYNFLT